MYNRPFCRGVLGSKAHYFRVAHMKNKGRENGKVYLRGLRSFHIIPGMGLTAMTKHFEAGTGRRLSLGWSSSAYFLKQSETRLSRNDRIVIKDKYTHTMRWVQ